MYKAPVCFLLCRNISPCAGGLARGSKPSSLSIFYELWHRASFIIFQPKFYRRPGCYKIFCLNSLHLLSQRNINGDLGLPLMFCNRGCFIQTTKWRGNHSITKCLLLPLVLQTQLGFQLSFKFSFCFFLKFIGYFSGKYSCTLICKCCPQTRDWCLRLSLRVIFRAT